MENNEKLFCKDVDGNEYELIEMPYIPGKHDHACSECAFLVRGVCKMIKTCTPKDEETGKALVKSGGWRRIENLEKKI